MREVANESTRALWSVCRGLAEKGAIRYPPDVETVSCFASKNNASSEVARLNELRGREDEHYVYFVLEVPVPGRYLIAEEVLRDLPEEELGEFDDLLQLDDRSVQQLLKEVEMNTLRFALCGSSDDIKELFLRNLSRRAGAMLLDDLEIMEADATETLASQRSMLRAANRLEEAGRLVLTRRDRGSHDA